MNDNDPDPMIAAVAILANIAAILVGVALLFAYPWWFYLMFG